MYVLLVPSLAANLASVSRGCARRVRCPFFKDGLGAYLERSGYYSVLSCQDSQHILDWACSCYRRSNVLDRNSCGFGSSIATFWGDAVALSFCSFGLWNASYDAFSEAAIGQQSKSGRFVSDLASDGLWNLCWVQTSRTSTYESKWAQVASPGEHQLWQMKRQHNVCYILTFSWDC